MGSAITIEQIGTNRYAPEGSNAINTFTFNGLSGMTLGKLIMAICVQRASIDESMSVLTMNRMDETASKMAATGNVLEQVMDETTSWDTVIDIASSGYVPRKVSKTATLKEFLETEIGVTGLPDKLDTVQQRIEAADKIKVQMDALNRSSEEDSVELQSQISRRDVEYRTAASTVYSLGQAGQVMANSLL